MRGDFPTALARSCDASAQVARSAPRGHLGLRQGRPTSSGLLGCDAYADNVIVYLITTATTRDEAASAVRVGSFRLAASSRTATTDLRSTTLLSPLRSAEPVAPAKRSDA
jgi:hypothetical protein